MVKGPSAAPPELPEELLLDELLLEELLLEAPPDEPEEPGELPPPLHADSRARQAMPKTAMLPVPGSATPRNAM
jgi:hypothetical protein